MNSLCTNCPDRDQCIKICSAGEKYINIDYVALNKKEFLSDNVESIKGIIEWPEGELELNLDDWRYLIKNYKITHRQKKFIFLRFWKRLSYSQIGQRYKVSPQAVEQAISRFINKNKCFR